MLPQQPSDPYKSKDWLSVIRGVYRLRIAWVLTTLGALTLFFYAADWFVTTYSDQYVGWFWDVLKSLPIRALADACLTTALVGFAYEWFVRRESEAALSELITEQLGQQKSAIIEEIPRAMLIDKEVISRVLKATHVEDIIRTGLQVKLGDTQMGSDIYDGLLRKTLSYSERWSNYRFKITLSRIRDPQATDIARAKYYQATLDLRYETRLTKSTYEFRCVSDIEDYNRSVRNPANDYTFLFPPAFEYPVIDTTVFDVEKFTINSLELEIERKTDDRGNLVINCGHSDLRQLEGQIVTIYYRHVAKLNKRGHLYTANVTVPTKNVVIELDYADTDIHYVNVLDFFVSTELPKITYLPSKAKAHKIEVELNEWAFPKGGVVFVWVLEKEMTDAFLLPGNVRKPR